MTRHDKYPARGKEIHRIEALSDGVFAFSVSLLAASLEAPQTFTELRHIAAGALPFLATVALLFLLWYQQYSFFRHYGLHDLTTIVLNMCYLATIIFYIYPLKFMFSLLLTNWTGIDLFPRARQTGEPVILQEELNQVIMLFSLGYAIVWLLLYLMHRRALRLAARLQLNAYERIYTAKEIRGAIMHTLLGVLTFVFALFNWSLAAGFFYLLIPLLLVINHFIFVKQKKALHA